MKPLLNETEFRNTEKIVAAFGSGVGPTLHARLLELKRAKDADGRESWLSDIWFKRAYLVWRMPSYVNVNWAMIAIDHPAATRSHEVDPVARASFLVWRMATSRRDVVLGQWPTELDRNKHPMCMDQFNR